MAAETIFHRLTADVEVYRLNQGIKDSSCHYGYYTPKQKECAWTLVKMIIQAVKDLEGMTDVYPAEVKRDLEMDDENPEEVMEDSVDPDEETEDDVDPDEETEDNVDLTGVTLDLEEMSNNGPKEATRYFPVLAPEAYATMLQAVGEEDNKELDVDSGKPAILFRSFCSLLGVWRGALGDLTVDLLKPPFCFNQMDWGEQAHNLQGKIVGIFREAAKKPGHYMSETKEEVLFRTFYGLVLTAESYGFKADKAWDLTDLRMIDYAFPPILLANAVESLVAASIMLRIFVEKIAKNRIDTNHKNLRDSVKSIKKLSTYQAGDLLELSRVLEQAAGEGDLSNA